MEELRYLPQIIGIDSLSTSLRASQIFQFLTPSGRWEEGGPFICFVLISISALQGSMISFSIYLFILFATFIYVRKLEILN